MSNEDSLFVLDLNSILPSEEDVTKFAILLKNKESLVKVLADDTSDEKLASLEKLCLGLGVNFDEFINSIITINLFNLATCSVELGE